MALKANISTTELVCSHPYESTWLAFFFSLLLCFSFAIISNSEVSLKILWDCDFTRKTAGFPSFIWMLSFHWNMCISRCSRFVICCWVLFCLRLSIMRMNKIWWPLVKKHDHISLAHSPYGEWLKCLIQLTTMASSFFSIALSTCSVESLKFQLRHQRPRFSCSWCAFFLSIQLIK